MFQNYNNNILSPTKINTITPFLSGMGSLLNLSPTMNPFTHRVGAFFINSDYEAIHQDFRIIGNDLYSALDQFKKELRCR